MRLPGRGCMMWTWVKGTKGREGNELDGPCRPGGGRGVIHGDMLTFSMTLHTRQDKSPQLSIRKTSSEHVRA